LTLETFPVSKRFSFHATPLWVLLVGTMLVTAIAISYGGGEYIRAQEMSRLLAQHQKKVESSLTLLASAMADAVVVQDTPILKKAVDEMNDIVEGVHSVRIINDFNRQIFSWQSGTPVMGDLKQFTSEIRRGKDQYMGKLLLVWDSGETVKEIARQIQEVRFNIAIFMTITGLVMLIWMHMLVIDPVMRINQRLKLGSASEPLKQHWWTARELLRLKHTVSQLEEVTISKEELEKEVERRKEAEVALIDLRDEALEASRAKSAFLANMSHELRTPLNAVIGYSEMLKDDAIDQGMEDYVDDLGKIHSAGRHLLTLINEVLDLSKVEAGKMELHLETFDLTELIRAVTSTIDPMAKKNSNSIRTVRLDSPLLMRADFTKVRQILLNLLSNAIKFTDHGEVTISINHKSVEGVEGVEIDVMDSGIGITREAMECIFEPFQQADASTTRKYGGTGLGLALCRRFCEMMGGYIRVKSEVGKGAIFTIWLPQTVDEVNIEHDADKRKTKTLATNPKDKRLPEGAANHLKRSERRKRIATVLTIDDDPSVLELMERVYNREGFRAISARSGEEGLDLARKVNPDLITLDIMMPGMDGWEVLRKMKEDEVLREIPVIMVSIVENKPMALDVGALASLTKPIAWDRLLDLTRMAVRGQLKTIK
jgi:signal transduction histidine kinase/ActR/RegA family two-component response regulator